MSPLRTGSWIPSNGSSHDAPEHRGYALGMCRSIKTLRTGPVPASDDEISAAALQYVRKVSGYRKPSAANEHAFDEAVEAVAAASKQLLEAVALTHPQAARRIA